MSRFDFAPNNHPRMDRRDFLRLLAVAAGGVASSSVLAACGGLGAPSEAAESANVVPVGMVDTSKFTKKGPWKIAHSSQGPTNSWLVMYDAHIEYGTTDLYGDQFSEFIYTDCNGSADKQVNDMQDILVQKPDAIILTPVGAAALVGVVEQAMSEGIPVILGSSKVDTDNYVSFVEPNNYTFGQECAKYIVDKLDGKGNVIMLSGIAGASAAEDRLAGARAIFAQSPEIVELGQAYCDWSPVIGKQATEAFIAANEQIDAVWSDSGVMCLGAIPAFQEAGRSVPPTTGEQFNGYLRMLVDNNLDGFSILYPPAIGLTAVELAIATLNGDPVPHYMPAEMDKFADADIADLYTPDMPDDYWPGHRLPDEWIDKLFG